ncbi:MAG TPA: DNA polymerase ligase N-terminal domain-containing protein [Streptosporangiaceae bacterium]|nr:DNA polymerase ligase N-terminal domain-containing protein [Streptosporangiaceae bacterium]
MSPARPRPARSGTGGKPAARKATTRKPAERTAGRKQAEGKNAAGPLDSYQRKRDFSKTPEPRGSAAGQPADGAARFVVQRHRARRLHYDLRFEIDGVLVSWAVPKGPTLDPDVKRIAIHVEDHPIEYLDFEGVIPAGGYGGGDVIVWDCGTWVPHETDDPAAAVAAGDFHADVYGEKLRGRLILVRSSDPSRSGGSGQEQWLLLHKHDEDAVPGWDPEDHPRSVRSGRTNDEVKADPEREWHSELPAAQASVPVGPGTGKRTANRSTTARRPGGGQRARRPAAASPALPSELLRPPDELSRLDVLGSSGTLDVFGRRLKLTNLDKVLFPARPGQDPVTKRELIRYAIQIAPVALPYLADRALNMHRFPGGAGSPGFWHKQLPEHAPGWIGRWDNPEAEPGKVRTYLVVDEPAALVWAANFGALEWHAWTARTDHQDQPDYALIDIDPGTQTSWDDVLVLARLHRAALDHLGVLARPKLTGRRGIQIWVPVAPGPGFADTRSWVEQLSKSIGAVVPELVSWKWDVRERGGKARLDYTQNVRHKTLVAPYSPRAEAGAPVSAPIEWEDLDDPGLRPDGITIRTVLDRLADRGDPFRALLSAGQPLPDIV